MSTNAVPAERYVPGALDRVDRLHVADKQKSERVDRGLMLAAISPFVTDEVWDYALREAFREE